MANDTTEFAPNSRNDSTMNIRHTYAIITRWSGRLSIVFLFGLLAALCCHRIIDVDLWWHLKAGQQILHTGCIPHSDYFSFTSIGNTWIDLHWLYQVILYACFSLGGSTALFLFTYLILAGLFAFMLMTCSYRKGNYIITSLFLLLGLLAFERFHARPEIVSELFIVIYLWIFSRYRSCQTRMIYCIPVLQLLWVNIEGLFVLGLVLIGAFWLGELISSIWPTPVRPGHSRQRDWGKMIRLTVVTLLTGMACLANPYLLDGALFPLILFTRLGQGSDVFSATIHELAPPFTEIKHVILPRTFYAVLLWSSIISFIINFKRAPWSRLLIFIAFTYLSLLAIRNIPLFICVALPFTIMNYTDWLSRIRRRNSHPRLTSFLRTIQMPFHAFCILLTTTALVSVVSGHYAYHRLPLAQPGLGFSPYMYPAGACAYLREHPIDGNMFNNIGIGGYLCWDGYPDRPVFIDGRLEVHESEFYHEYIHTMIYPAYWEDLADKYEINYAVLQYTMGDTQHLIRHLHASPYWAPVYHDHATIIFVKADGRNRIVPPQIPATVSACSNSPTPRTACSGRYTIPFEQIHRGTLCALLGQSNDAVRSYEQAASINPRLINARYNLALAYIHSRQYHKALEELNTVLALNPKHLTALNSLGYVHKALKNDELAAQCYAEALRIHPDDLKSCCDMAKIQLQLGKPYIALKYAMHAVDINPQNPKGYIILAQIHNAMGQHGDAIQAAETARALDPRNTEAYNQLAYAQTKTGSEIDAVGTYKSCLSLAPSNQVALNNLGMLYARTGALREAEKMWKKLLAAHPNHHEARANMQKLRQMITERAYH